MASKPQTVEQQLRNANSELKEFRAWLVQNRDEIADLKKQVAGDKQLKADLYVSLFQERTDLISRVQRIDQRIHALGFRVQGLPGDPERTDPDGR